jgi:hypothetical protein
MNYPQDRLKQRLGDKIAIFNDSAKQLYNSTVTLSEVMKGENTNKINDAIQEVHSNYQILDAFFQ